jgi:hypothetical protein
MDALAPGFSVRCRLIGPLPGLFVISRLAGGVPVRWCSPDLPVLCRLSGALTARLCFPGFSVPLRALEDSRCCPGFSVLYHLVLPVFCCSPSLFVLYGLVTYSRRNLGLRPRLVAGQAVYISPNLKLRISLAPSYPCMTSTTQMEPPSKT